MTKQVQSSAINAETCTTGGKVTLLSAMFNKMSGDINEHHEIWLEEAIKLAGSVGTVPGKPMTVASQKSPKCPSPISAIQLKKPFNSVFASAKFRSDFLKNSLDTVYKMLFMGFPRMLLKKMIGSKTFKVFGAQQQLRYLRTELEIWEETCKLKEKKREKKEKLPSAVTKICTLPIKIPFQNFMELFEILLQFLEPLQLKNGPFPVYNAWKDPFEISC